MKKMHLAVALIFVATMTLAGSANADGTETLGPPSVTLGTGTGVVAAGVGTQGSSVTGPKQLTVAVPAGAVVKQVLLYWEGHATGFNFDPCAGGPQLDGVISVNGTPVAGTQIGGPTNFFMAEYFAAYRADVTSRGLVSAGSNVLTISDMRFVSCFDGYASSDGNDGVGVIVIYDDGTSAATTDVRDGLDMAYAGFGAPLDATVPQTFTFAPSTLPRTANLSTLVGSVLGPDAPGPRANQLSITFDVGPPITIQNPWQSNSGFEFDAVNTPVTIPAGAASMTVRAISDTNSPASGTPSSLAWIGAALSVPNPLLGALGDFVWNDVNKDGIQNAGEAGISGVTVRLLDCAGNVISATTTDADGLYLFSSLAAGGYAVQFVLLNGYVFSPANQGSSDAVDSDANTTTGMTGCYTLAEGETNPTVDAGMYQPPQLSGETATGYGYRYPNTSNWFMYTPYTTNKVDLVAGRKHQDAGDIYMSRSGSGSSARTTIRITLHTGWSWDAVDEVLKIQPFERAPITYVQPGAFVYKFTAPDVAKHTSTTVVFAGQTVTVTMGGTSARFYGIHADVLH